MDVGLYISEGIRVRIGDTFSSITSKLENSKVDYKIPYDGTRDINKEKSIILFIEQCGVELTIVDKKVVYIKSYNDTSNTIIDLGDNNDPIIVLQSIILGVGDALGVDTKSIYLESFDSDNYTTTLKIKVDKSKFIRISIRGNKESKAYHINTVRLVENNR